MLRMLRLAGLPLVAAALACCWLPPPCRAELGDPTIRTDHPQYAGEGAFQTVEDCVRFATKDLPANATPQDKAIALYLWLLTHQWHLLSPQEPYVPGAAADAKAGDQENIVYDANRARFSYGYGLCGTVHAWNEPYWKALGLNVRRRAFPGHTNSEVEYDGGWHAFDTDMAGLIFRPDGVVAGYADVARNPALATAARPPLPCYPFAWPGDRNAMRDGWQAIAKGGDWFPMYHAGYAAQPGVVHLRSGETFTRYFDRDHFGGASGRRFWHHQPGGPFRDWTFANQGQPEHIGPKSNARGNASYCNGEFVHRPNLASGSFREGTAAAENVVSREQSPRLGAREGGAAAVTFQHFSPYVICGDPADDANPMTGPASGGLVVAGKIVGEARLAVSADGGQTWQDQGPQRGAFELDLTDAVKGRYGWQVRLNWNGAAGLDELTFTTVTQVCQAMYPRLKAGGSAVTVRSTSQAVVPVLPNWALDEQGAAGWEEVSLRSANVVYAPRSKGSRNVYRTTNNKPGQVVFRVDSPTELVEVAAAVRFAVRVPPPAGCEFRLELSTDGGRSWAPLGGAEIPADNQYSSGWMFGRKKLPAGGAKQALVRAHFYHGGYTAGLIDAQLYGLRRTADPQAAELTYAWQENGAVKESRHALAAGSAEQTFTIPTGTAIVDQFVRLAVP